MLAGLIAVAAALGLATGSHVVAAVDRAPVRPWALAGIPCCRDCGRPPGRWLRVPVAGWLALRGRCAGCGASIGVRLPLVEVAAGALFAAVTVFAWQRGQLPLAPALLYLSAAGLALALIDVDLHRLPNSIVLPSYPVLAVLLTGASAWSGDWAGLGRSAAGAAALAGGYLLLVLLHPAGMGWGDVKLSGLLGGAMAYFGWDALVVGAFAGFCFGAVAAIALIASGRGTRSTALAFGPFMLAGAAFGIAAGGWVAGTFLNISGA